MVKLNSIKYIIQTYKIKTNYPLKGYVPKKMSDKKPKKKVVKPQEEKDPKEAIQKYILEGRKVLIKKENETSFVRIRFNNNDTDGTMKWRVIINGNLFHTSEIVINCQTRTLTETFEDVGVKHHMVCNANEILFENNIAYIK